MPAAVRAPSPRTARWIIALGVALAAVVAVVLALVARLGAAGGGGAPTLATGGGEMRGIALPSPYAAPPIDLATADGRRFRLADARGRTVLLFFGYTRCPDVCP